MSQLLDSATSRRGEAMEEVGEVSARRLRLLMRVVASAAVLLCASACSLLGSIGDARQFQSSALLVGTVHVPPGYERTPLIVAAIDVHTGDVEHRARVPVPGSYELLVARCQYRVVAFVDSNGNGVFDENEPAGISQRIDADVGTVLVEAGNLSMDSVPREAHEELALLRAVTRVDNSRARAAEVTPLDAPEISAATGRSGYWAPQKVFRQYGSNIHFIEPYDASRIPVLFVHGAAGSPQDWRTMIDALDRTRYQAWLFQYPSGAPLEAMGELLYRKLASLRRRFAFDDLHIVAHSMGGLVVRSFLTRRGSEFPQIRTFVSLSTPWSGVSAAAVGVKMSPLVVPSWRDLQPNGPFIDQVLARPLPVTVRHYLYFGHRSQGWVHFSDNDDGTVSLASQLDPRAQRQARAIVGFDEDHGSILRSTATIHQLLAALRD